jgi:hypothetical protein
MTSNDYSLFSVFSMGAVQPFFSPIKIRGSLAVFPRNGIAGECLSGATLPVSPKTGA